MTEATVTARITDISKVDQRTQYRRWSDPLTCGWLSTSQAWAFEGGDALVVVGELGGQVTGFTVLRLADKVSVFVGSLHAALRAENIELEVA